MHALWGDSKQYNLEACGIKRKRSCLALFNHVSLLPLLSLEITMIINLVHCLPDLFSFFWLLCVYGSHKIHFKCACYCTPLFLRIQSCLCPGRQPTGCPLALLLLLTGVVVSDPLRSRVLHARLHGVLQGRNPGVGCHFLLQWIFWTRDWTHFSCIGRWIFFTTEPPGKPYMNSLCSVCMLYVLFHYTLEFM